MTVDLDVSLGVLVLVAFEVIVKNRVLGRLAEVDADVRASHGGEQSFVRVQHELAAEIDPDRPAGLGPEPDRR
ncbi:hypothetical protein ACN27F_11245 [Solwaraspora sp. WMMB335]|uniref:hypothetical protein n=1 Tax=Solwaraspora sp. WMMB335 TaxID=3404118 RepID=UPI003B94E593